MAKLHKMHDIVFNVLKETPDARGDDFALYAYVCAWMGKDIDTPIWRLAAYHARENFPSWETVTRCRRKIQHDHPELCDPNAKKRRSAEIEQYKDYSRE